MWRNNFIYSNNYVFLKGDIIPISKSAKKKHQIEYDSDESYSDISLFTYDSFQLGNFTNKKSKLDTEPSKSNINKVCSRTKKLKRSWISHKYFIET